MPTSWGFSLQEDILVTGECDLVCLMTDDNRKNLTTPNFNYDSAVQVINSETRDKREEKSNVFENCRRLQFRAVLTTTDVNTRPPGPDATTSGSTSSVGREERGK